MDVLPSPETNIPGELRRSKFGISDGNYRTRNYFNEVLVHQVAGRLLEARLPLHCSTLSHP